MLTVLPSQTFFKTASLQCNARLIADPCALVSALVHYYAFMQNFMGKGLTMLVWEAPWVHDDTLYGREDNLGRKVRVKRNTARGEVECKWNFLKVHHSFM